jgi:hypothetical protein
MNVQDVKNEQPNNGNHTQQTDFIDLNSLLDDYIEWASISYSYEGISYAHITLARLNYLKKLENKREDLALYSILWDISLWIHGYCYLEHPKETFFELLKDSGVQEVTESEIACFYVFDDMLHKGEAQKYINTAIDSINFAPIAKNKFKKVLFSIVNYNGKSKV